MTVKKKNIYITILCALVLCVFLSSCISENTINESNNLLVTFNPTEPITHTPKITAEPTPTVEPYTTIIIGSTGDIMIHEMMLKDAQHMAEGEYNYTKNGDEQYSFDHWFRYISESIEHADLMIGNFESTIAINNSMASGYPYFATPKEILYDLDEAGFDVLLSANNHILDRGPDGLIATVNAMKEVGFYHTGAWSSLESKNTPLVIDVNGIKVGIISATSSLNEMELRLSEEQKQYMYLKTDDLNGISQQIANCKNHGAEVIVMCPHWGYEYKELPNVGVLNLAQEYIKLGADIILAHHPHVLHPVENVTVTLENGTTRQGIVFYSLGNFISNQMGKLEQLAGAIGYVSITRNNLTGELTFDSASYLPIWCYIKYDDETATKTYCVLPAGEALDNPQAFPDIDISALKHPLQDTWDLALDRMGNDVANPLRSVSDD